MDADEILSAPQPHPDSPEATTFRADLVEALTAAVEQARQADDLATALMAKGRQLTPPVPLETLARAAGLSESGVSVRVRRARRTPRNTQTK